MIRTRIVSESVVSNPDSVFPLLSRWRNSRTEKFFVVTLDSAHVPIHTYVVSSGIVNRTLIHPREVFWYAIKDMASAIIIAHNHPSGRLDPSPGDREITERLQDAGQILGIPILDHIIFGRKTAPYSFVASGLLDP